MGLEPKKRRSPLVSLPPKSYTVKGKQTARVRIDAEGRCLIVLCGVLTLEAINERDDLPRIRTRRELERVKGLLESSFSCLVVFSISEAWEKALPEGGEQNGGVSDE